MSKTHDVSAWVLTLCFLFAFSSFAVADTLSYTGTLSTSTSTFIQPFTVATGGTVNMQTWGFGGGMNAMGTPISAGGFDPQVVLFSGTGPGATFIDGTSAISTNYYLPPDYTQYSSLAGCGPAGLRTINGVSGICGDVHLVETLAAGNYTLVLSTAEYIDNALNAGSGVLGDGFTDTTNGVFELCAYDPANPTNCATLGNSFAVDIVTPSGNPTVVPEPGTLLLLGSGLLAGLLKRPNNGYAVSRARSAVFADRFPALRP